MKNQEKPCATAWSAIVIADCGNGQTVLVRNPHHETPYWKFPGGRKEPYESEARQTAIREVEEETGLLLSENHLILIQTIPRATHSLHIFAGRALSLETLKEIGNDGEEVRLFPIKEVFSFPELLPDHRRILKHIGVTR